MNAKELKIYKCKRCGHQWANRKPRKPYICPKCKSYLWDVAKEDDAEIGK